MSLCVQRTFLLVCLGSALAPSATARQDGDPNDPRFVLEQIRKRLATISNYQCTLINGGIEKRIAYNRQGRGRIREIDDNGNATSLIWDGTRTIQVHERIKPTGTVIHSATIFPGRHVESGRGNVASGYLGGSVISELKQALASEARISVAPTEDGRCYLETHLGPGAVMARVLDPKRGYLPIRHEMIAQGEVRRAERAEFKAIRPGLWFPSAVWTQFAHVPASPGPRLRFTDVTINDPDFDRLLTPKLPDGSTVADEIRGVRYVVDHRRGLTLSGEASPSLGPGVQAQKASEAVYRLDANEALTRIAPVAPSARSQFIAGEAIDPGQVPEAALHNTIHIFQWDDAANPTVSYTGTGFLKLSEILPYICGLGIGEFSGPEHLLELRLTGDWIVRRDASRVERLASLERILRQETGRNITLERRRVEAQIARATGIFQYHPLPGAQGENDVQLFTERSVDERGTCTGRGSGTLAQLLRHITNRTGKRFVDDTLSSEVDVSWSDYLSLKLDPIRTPGTTYRYEMAQLLAHVAQQTDLTFTMERRTLDEWHVSVKP